MTPDSTLQKEQQKLKDRKDTVLAVIGGGRWGRVIVSVLTKMDLPFERIVVVSKANLNTMNSFLEEHQRLSNLPIALVSSLDELLERYSVKAAIVANAAHQHFDTSSRLIDHGINVLIEKPMVLSVEQAQILLKKAINQGVIIIPGLQYRFCSYIHNFAKELQRLEKIPCKFSIEWSDQIGEVRYGEVKSYDSTINVAQDVMPHIWSILSTIFCQTQINIISCQTARGGKCAEFSVEMENGAPGQIVLERDADQRRRLIKVHFESGEFLSMDFSNEPGVISWNNKVISINSNWNSDPKPLASQLQYFLSAINAGVILDLDSDACLNSVSFSEQASDLLAYKNLYENVIKEFN